MRYLILSDLHANLEALEAVLEAVAGESFDATILLGDLVGYGASPVEVTERMMGWNGPIHHVRGNHDRVVAGLEPADDFNPIARASLLWTAEQMPEAQVEFLRALPAGPVWVGDDVLACHGSPQDEDLYLLVHSQAEEAFEFGARIVLFGHTHMAGVFERKDGRIRAAVPSADVVTLELSPPAAYLINPGSVGQPRDGDPRAAYGVLEPEDDLFTWHRVSYAVEAAQERIRRAGLPALLADRLEIGA